MRERPPGVTDSVVLAAVRAHWNPTVDHVEYLPVGFGAYHWRAERAGEPIFFVTLDTLGERHDLCSVSTSYAAAAALAASGLEFVHSGSAPYAVRFGRSALSITPWREGTTRDAIDAEVTRSMLSRLHASTPPPLAAWRPLVPEHFAAELTDLVRRPWSRGPYGERAREAVLPRLPDVKRWVRRYHARAGDAARRPWVVTHGEPHAANQMVTDRGTLLVDWESVKLAPAERDLSVLGDGDAGMLELFDLEWRLDEIRQYTSRFAGSHSGREDDVISYAGLLHELSRPDAGDHEGIAKIGP